MLEGSERDNRGLSLLTIIYQKFVIPFGEAICKIPDMVDFSVKFAEVW